MLTMCLMTLSEDDKTTRDRSTTIRVSTMCAMTLQDDLTTDNAINVTIHQQEQTFGKL